MDELKLDPCPFCGFGASLINWYANKWKIVCDHCTAEIGTYIGRQVAIAAWNRRADDGLGGGSGD